MASILRLLPMFWCPHRRLVYPLPSIMQVVSSVLAGAAVGSVAGSGLADSLGRKKAFLLDSIPMLAGALVCASAQGLAGMLAGRLLTGVGIGISSALVPLYISEVRCWVCWVSLCCRDGSPAALSACALDKPLVPLQLFGHELPGN